MFGDASWTELAGRLLIVGFFVAAGLFNLAAQRVKDHIALLAGFGVPFPAVAYWAGLAVQFAGCALVLADWHAEIGAWLLIVFTVAANALFHRYWTVQDPGRRNVTRLLLLNGIAILGGLFLLLESVKG
ncbi:MAG TPA: DoxX family protein [Burkholderiales bacterium]|nr:DoxX family protein [Burkholderiales bacterium]